MKPIACLLLLLVSLLLLPPAATAEPTRPPVIVSDVPCVGGEAAGFPCQNIDLLSYVSLDELNPPVVTGDDRRASDLWGWVYPETGDEYALVGLRKGTAFVNVTAPTAPVVEGFLPTAAEDTPGREGVRDVKVYANHAFIVAETRPHGMQVVDLTRLPDVVPVAHYTGFDSAHNIAINEATGYAYVVGSFRAEAPLCNYGLHVVDVRDPTAPTYAGCFDATGYVHDAQCLRYPPGSPYAGREICFLANAGSGIAIVDVTDKANMALLATATYPTLAFAHQLWLTEDRQHLLLGDEFDERQLGLRTTTYIWEVANLTQPRLVATYAADTPAIDHNLYVRGARAFLSNYRAGLRVLDISDVRHPTEIAFFDVYPPDDAPVYSGAWSSYPFLPSGNVLVSGIEQGLFVLRPQWRQFLPTLQR